MTTRHDTSEPPPRTGIAERYDHNAHRYDDVTAYNRDAANRLVASLPAGRYRTLLDVGCGTGFATMAMLERFAPEMVVGVDISAQMLEQFARKLAGHDSLSVTLHVANVLDMPAPPGGADCVLASMMLHWLRDRPAAVAAMARALAPGGILGIVAPGPGHDREYADLLRTVDPPVPHEVIDVFRAAQVFPNDTERAMTAAGLDVLDVWVETRARRVPPDRYMARITAVGSHVWTDLMGPEAAEAMLARIVATLNRALDGDGLFIYTFTKTYAIARRPD